MEFIIEICDHTDRAIAVGTVERNNTMSWSRVSPSAYQYSTRFKDKVRASKLATKLIQQYNLRMNANATVRVVPDFGGYVGGSKSSVAGKQADRIRRN